jgi:hypothetical protein
MHNLLLMLSLAAERPAPVAIPLGPLSVSAAVVAVPRGLPGGEAADLSLRVYAMRGPVGACLTLAELEGDDQDGVGVPTTLGGAVVF